MIPRLAQKTVPTNSLRMQHVEVEQDRVDTQMRQHVESIHAAPGRQDLEVVIQLELQDLADGWIVVDAENGRTHLLARTCP